VMIQSIAPSWLRDRTARRRTVAGQAKTNKNYLITSQKIPASAMNASVNRMVRTTGIPAQ
jgi:hypothetical protein